MKKTSEGCAKAVVRLPLARLDDSLGLLDALVLAGWLLVTLYLLVAVVTRADAAGAKKAVKRAVTV
jgi:hypothetical protein